MFQSRQNKAPVQASQKLFWYNLQNHFSSYFDECWIIGKTATESTRFCYPSPCASWLSHKPFPGWFQPSCPTAATFAGVWWGSTNHRTRAPFRALGRSTTRCQDLLSPSVKVAWAGAGWRRASSSLHSKSPLQTDCSEDCPDLILLPWELNLLLSLCGGVRLLDLPQFSFMFLCF